MPTSYVKSLSTDFSGSLREGQLDQEIFADSGIPPAMCIEVDGDVVTIMFSSALSGAEQTVLDDIIAAHSPVVPTSSLDDILSRLTALEAYH